MKIKLKILNIKIKHKNCSNVCLQSCACAENRRSNSHHRFVLLINYCKVAGSNITCRDDSKTRWRLHSVNPTSMGLSSLGQNIIHSPVARVVYGWWALAYKLTRMPGSTENVPHRAIWRLRGSLDENASFSSLSHTFRLIWLYRHSLQ